MDGETSSMYYIILWTQTNKYMILNNVQRLLHAINIKVTGVRWYISKNKHNHRGKFRFGYDISISEIRHLAIEFRNDLGEDLSDHPPVDCTGECYFTCPVNYPIEAAPDLKSSASKTPASYNHVR